MKELVYHPWLFPQSPISGKSLMPPPHLLLFFLPLSFSLHLLPFGFSYPNASPFVHHLLALQRNASQYNSFDESTFKTLSKEEERSDPTIQEENGVEDKSMKKEEYNKQEGLEERGLTLENEAYKSSKKVDIRSVADHQALDKIVRSLKFFIRFNHLALVSNTYVKPRSN